MKSLCLLCGCLLLVSLKTFAQKEVVSKSASISAGDVVERIKKNVTCSWSKKTVDTFKEGSASVKVTGIATTFLATMDVLKKAQAAGLNMVITHEPTYYNHLDETTFFKNDPVFEAKRRFIKDHNMVVFRFHDHWHRTHPDGIHKGVIRKLGWENFQNDPDQMIFTLSSQTLTALAQSLKEAFKASSIRIVGDPEMKISKVGVRVGAPGSKSQITMLRNDQVEVLVGGETPEWETVEYVRDAQGQGKIKALILIGHANSEEAGMEYCAEWLEGFIDEIPVRFVPAHDPFWTP